MYVKLENLLYAQPKQTMNNERISHTPIHKYKLNNILAQETDYELCRQFNSPRDRFTNKIYFKCLVSLHTHNIYIYLCARLIRRIFTFACVKILNAQLCDLLGYLYKTNSMYNKSLSPTKQLLSPKRVLYILTHATQYIYIYICMCTIQYIYICCSLYFHFITQMENYTSAKHKNK